MSALLFALVAALGNLVGGYAVVRRERRVRMDDAHARHARDAYRRAHDTRNRDPALATRYPRNLTGFVRNLTGFVRQATSPRASCPS